MQTPYAGDDGILLLMNWQTSVKHIYYVLLLF